MIVFNSDGLDSSNVSKDFKDRMNIAPYYADYRIKFIDKLEYF